jgi:hypothetical protein
MKKLHKLLDTITYVQMIKKNGFHELHIIVGLPNRKSNLIKINHV